MQHARALAAVALLLATPALARQLPAVDAGRPIILRLDGVVQAVRQRGTVGFAVISLRLLGGKRETRYLAVTDARTIGGDPGVLGKDVLDTVQPYEPDLMLSGPAPLLDRLHAAAVGDRVNLEGTVRTAARTYFLRDVTVTPLEPPTTTTLPPPAP